MSSPAGTTLGLLATVRSSLFRHFLLSAKSRFTADYWRRGRRVMHSMLTKKACVNHLTIQRAEASQLMYDYLVEPKVNLSHQILVANVGKSDVQCQEFVAHGQRYANSVITSILAGTRSPHHTSPLVTAFFQMQHEWTHLLTPGAHPPVDMVPFLKYIPGSWKQICAKMKVSQEELYGGMIDACAKRVERGIRNGCFLEGELENKDVDRGLLRYVLTVRVPHFTNLYFTEGCVPRSWRADRIRRLYICRASFLCL